MPLAPELLVRTLVRPGGRVTTVVLRRRRTSPVPAGGVVPESQSVEAVQEKPYRSGVVPACDMIVTTRFSQPVACALAALGPRARPSGCDDVTLDGRRVPLIRMMAEANRCLLAAGKAPIPYPGLRLLERRR